MYLIVRDENRVTSLRETSFAELGFRERANVREWIANTPSVLGEDLMQGNLVIIENKLDDSGRDVTWKALGESRIRLFREANLRHDVTPYALRHSHTTMLLQTLPVKVVSTGLPTLPSR